MSSDLDRNPPGGRANSPWRRLPALPAYWVGILYDDDALDAAWNLVKTWTAEERQKLRDEVPKLGFASVIAGCDVLQLAKTAVALAEKGWRAAGASIAPATTKAGIPSQSRNMSRAGSR